MKKVIVLILVFIVTLIAINLYYRFFPPVDRIVYYTYQDVNVTRIEKANKIYFYYGKCNEKDSTCPEPSVVIRWREKFGLRGYLLFHPDKTVQIINGGGGLYKTYKGGSRQIFMKNYENPQLSELLDPFRNSESFNNLMEFSDGIKLEREINNRNNSQVKAEYVYLSENGE